MTSMRASPEFELQHKTVAVCIECVCIYFRLGPRSSDYTQMKVVRRIPQTGEKLPVKSSRRPQVSEFSTRPSS